VFGYIVEDPAASLQISGPGDGDEEAEWLEGALCPQRCMFIAHDPRLEVLCGFLPAILPNTCTEKAEEIPDLLPGTGERLEILSYHHEVKELLLRRWEQFPEVE
jgi:hypothetical protein